MEDIVDRLFKLVDAKYDEQRNFAADIGVTPSVVSEWRRRKSASYVKRLEIISKTLNTTPQYLLSGDIEPKETSPNATVLSHLDADAIAVAEAYAQADEKSRAMVRLALNLDTDVPLAAHGGPSGKISAKTAEALEKGAVESTGDI